MTTPNAMAPEYRPPGPAHWIAAVISIVYGFGKLSGSQFTVLDSELARPMGEVSGFWLTWHFFEYSRVYGTGIALVQVIGGAMLVLPRLSLLGALCLVPVVVNIVLVDVFYGVGGGALVVAVILLLCLVAIVMPHLPRLRQAVVPSVAPRAGMPRLGALAMVVAGAWAFSWWAANVNNREPTPIDGVWEATRRDAETGLFGTTRQVFFEYNRARMAVFRADSGPDQVHGFEMDSTRTIRIWKTWLRHDSLIASGLWQNDSTIILGTTGRETLTLIRRRPPHEFAR